MLKDRIEANWIDTFERVFTLSAVGPGDAVAILSESQSREVNVHLAELALLRLGAKPFHIVLPTPPQRAPVPIRSTGATNVIGGMAPVVGALAASTMVVDITVEGMMHARETREILKAGSRILYISNEHPEALERLAPSEGLKSKVEQGIAGLKQAKTMTVASSAGTDLQIGLDGAPCGGGWGSCAEPRRLDHWPGGLCLAFPGPGSVNGRLVLDRGDMNLTFKRYLETPVTLRIENDFVVAVEGDGLDAELMRSYFEAWDDNNAYAVSHVGWGMNQAARWDALTMYDKGDINGTEQRAFAGNFLYSTGANEFAKRFTLGHFDLPMRNCSVELDGEAVVVDGKLQGGLA
jgi:2,5-dihydroxypyridine 5,6-dioxygenase